MRIYKSILVIVLITIFSISAGAVQNLIYSSDSLLSKNDGDLTLRFENSSFIKNNEYFNNIVEGYTLIGFWATPSLQYQISEKSAIEAGVHLLKFAGRDQLYKSLPLFRFTQKIGKPVELILGTLKFNENHKMPAPMLDPERFYFNQADNGAQFLLAYRRFVSDIWLSWDKFSFYGDSTQEVITSGISSFIVSPISDNFIFRIPVHFLITHKGGQIFRPKNKPLETLINISNGLEFEWILNNPIIKRVVFSPRYFLYQKNSNSPTQPFKNGWAMQPLARVQLKDFTIEGSYWYSNKFIGPRGEAIYQSISTIPPQDYQEKIRKLIIGKIAYFHTLPKYVSIMAGFEGYYDQSEKIFDYNFYLNINCALDWKLGNYAIRE